MKNRLNYNIALIANSDDMSADEKAGYGENQGNSHKSKPFEKVSKSIDVPDWYKRGVLL